MNNPKNATETAVDNELRRLRASGPVAAVPCWCEACQADVRALSLSSLPPNYCTTFDFEEVLKRTGTQEVRETVAVAVDRVARYPKHNRLPSQAAHPELRIINFSLEEGSTIIDEMATTDRASCDCPACRTDTLAYALNRYPAKYGVERGGHIDFPRNERERIRRELSTIMSRAVTIVASKPRHS